MQWFRSHHGAPFDSKLAVVAKRANVTRGHAASVWWAVLDHASQQNDRGNVVGIDPEEIAAAYDYDEDDVARVLDAMRHKALLIDDRGQLTGWNKRQVQREDETAVDRKRAQRSRDMPGRPARSRKVTQRHAPDKTREDTDQSREDKKVPPLSPPEGDDAVRLWNELAERHGLAAVQKRTKPRMAKLKARLADCGGLEGWRAALAKIEETPGLRPKKKGAWKVDFDFLLAESKFVKLMEGKYDGWGADDTDHFAEQTAADRRAILDGLDLDEGGEMAGSVGSGESSLPEENNPGNRGASEGTNPFDAAGNGAGDGQGIRGGDGEADGVRAAVRPAFTGREGSTGYVPRNVEGFAGGPAFAGDRADEDEPQISRSAEAGEYPGTGERGLGAPATEAELGADNATADVPDLTAIPDFLRRA